MSSYRKLLNHIAHIVGHAGVAESLISSISTGIGNHVGLGDVHVPSAAASPDEQSTVAPTRSLDAAESGSLSSIDDVEKRFFAAIHGISKDTTSHPKAALLRELITDESEITNARVSEALQFVYAHLVSKFQGCLAEFLAMRLCVELILDLKSSARLPQHACVIWGPELRERLLADEDAKLSDAWHQGADGLVIAYGTEAGLPRLVVFGAIEIKSNFTSVRNLELQIDKHLSRLLRGLKIGSSVWPAERIAFGEKRDDSSDWTESAVGTSPTPRLVRMLIKPPRSIKSLQPGPQRLRQDVYLLSLPFSRDALRSAAYAMTLWFVEQLGTQIFATSKNPWPDLTAEEAGINAIKESLYHALRRDLPEASNRIAVDLYNVYGFGFNDAKGRKTMMWGTLKAEDATKATSVSTDKTAASRLSVATEAAWSAYQTGQLNKSLAHANNALALGPDVAASARLHWLMGMSYYYLADFENAAAELSPPSVAGQDHWWMKNKLTCARIMGRLGRLDEMAAEIQDVVNASLTHQFAQLSVAISQSMLLLMQGKRDEAPAYINSTLATVFSEQDEMRDRKAKGLGVDRPMYLPIHEVGNVLLDAVPVVVGLQDFDRALQVLSRTEHIFKPYLQLMNRDPLLEPLRQDLVAGPQFKEWLNAESVKAGIHPEQR